MKTTVITFMAITLTATGALAAEFHLATNGNDVNRGTKKAPLRTNQPAFPPFTWKSEPPADCPFPPSKEITGLEFLGVHSDYRFADTWYPSWAADGNLYSPWTDGPCHADSSNSDGYEYVKEGAMGTFNAKLRPATTGQAVMVGDDPLKLEVKSLGTVQADPYPYGGRYPCGSLVYRGVWYYGTYCLSPHGNTRFGETAYNWPWLGPLVGFRLSRDLGKTWEETTHTPAKPLFSETGMWGHPVKIGAPHFVDFGKDMEHSPDGKAYLVAMGAELSDPKPRFGNLSWITGDQVYFVNLPSKFIGPDGRTAWLCYSGNFATDWNGNKIKVNPPGTRYGLVLQQIRLLGPTP